MATVTIEFQFSDSSSESEDFTAQLGLLSDVEDGRDRLLEERNADLAEGEEEIECTGYAVLDVDTDYSDQSGPEEFKDLNEWAEYCNLVEEHGEAFVLRYADIGDHDFEDEYNGCWSSFEEFAENFFDDCMECPDSLRCYIDYDKFAGDLEHDYSTYDGSQGVHVFRNC